MRTLLVVLILAAAMVAALYALGFFESATDSGNGTTVPKGTEGPGSGATSLGGAEREPASQPAIEVYPIDEPIHVLLLARYAERLPAFLAQQWAAHPRVTVWVWLAPAETTQEGGPPSADALATYGAKVLDAPPTPSWLAAENISVVALHAFPPDILDSAFWAALAERVQGGQTGLLVMPGRPEGASLLEQSSLAAVLPLAEAGRMEGQPLPGDLGGFEPFRLTEAGATHPASRLVGWPRWSRAIWDTKSRGDFVWGTSLCFPVEKIQDGAQTLLEVAGRRGPTYPVLVASASDQGRVLWLGAFEVLPRKGYGSGEVGDLQKLLQNWLAWLAGRAV